MEYIEDSKVIQIMPAENWWARYAHKENGVIVDEWYDKVVCFALTEQSVHGIIKRHDVHPMVWSDYIAFAGDSSNFTYIVYSETEPQPKVTQE